MATVFESSEPDSIILRQSGIISVVSKKLITSCSSVFTSAPEKQKTFRQNSFLFISEKISSLQKELTFWWSHKGSFTNYVDKPLAFCDHLIPLRWDLLPYEGWQKSDIFGTTCLPLLIFVICEHSIKQKCWFFCNLHK